MYQAWHCHLCCHCKLVWHPQVDLLLMLSWPACYLKYNKTMFLHDIYWMIFCTIWHEPQLVGDISARPQLPERQLPVIRTSLISKVWLCLDFFPPHRPRSLFKPHLPFAASVVWLVCFQLIHSLIEFTRGRHKSRDKILLVPTSLYVLSDSGTEIMTPFPVPIHKRLTETRRAVMRTNENPSFPVPTKEHLQINNN